MYENIGSCFSALRKSKHIPVSNIVGENISNSQYHRFVKNESDVSFNKFLLMLDQINITLEEFVFLAFDSSDPLKKGMLKVKEAFEKEDIDTLKSLAITFKEEHRKNEQIKFLHLSYVCDSLISKIEDSKNIPHGFLELKKYLLNVENWGHYELVLFNNTFFLFDEETVYNFFNQAKRTAINYQELFSHIREVIKLDSNVILFFLERNRAVFAVEVINDLETLQLSNEQLYEKSLVKFWQITKQYLIGEKNNAIKDMELLQKFFSFVDNDDYGKLLQGIFSFVKNKY